MGKRKPRKANANVLQSHVLDVLPDNRAPHTVTQCTVETPPILEPLSKLSSETLLSCSEIQPERESPTSTPMAAPTTESVSGVGQAQAIEDPIHVSEQSDTPMPEKAGTSFSQPSSACPTTWAGVTLLYSHLLLHMITRPGLLIETCRNVKSWFTYGGKPAGYNQRIRHLRRTARQQILKEAGLSPDARLEQCSDRRVHRVIGAVKMLFPNAKANDANRLAIQYEVCKAMKEAKFTEDEIYDLVHQVTFMVLIPNKQEIQALLMFNSGPVQATLRFKEELERGTNLGEGLGIFSNFYKIFPSRGMEN